jgi:glycosyltransferase involved in cell wall biosynthesis
MTNGSNTAGNLKLSFCIPTYNRAELLRECLDSVLASAKGDEDKIEIIVSDNASVDSTMEMVARFQEKHPFIRYCRNERNLGAEANVYSVATMASANYIWFLGDDDKIDKDAVPTILARIDHGYNLIVMNYSIWSRDFSVIRKRRALPAVDDMEFDDPDGLMKNFGIHLGYLSSIVMEKDAFLSVPYTEYKSYAEYGFSFMYAVYFGVIKNCMALYLALPLIHNRSDNSEGFEWNKYFVKGTALVFEALSRKGYSPKTVTNAKFNVLKEFVLPNIIGKKLNNGSTRGLFRLLLTHYSGSWLCWSVCLPVLFTPAFMFSLARIIKRGCVLSHQPVRSK